MAAVTGYRWSDGTLGAGVVLAPQYAIENFAVQVDMAGSSIEWRQPSFVSVHEATQVLVSLDGTRDGYGGAVIRWEFGFLTPLMMKYLRDTFFNTNLFSRANTIRTWNRMTGLWEEYTATAHWPTFEDINSLERRGGGLLNFPLVFIKGTKIA